MGRSEAGTGYNKSRVADPRARIAGIPPRPGPLCPPGRSPGEWDAGRTSPETDSGADGAKPPNAGPTRHVLSS